MKKEEKNHRNAFRFIRFMPFTSHFRSNFDRFCHHFRFLFFTLENRNARIDIEKKFPQAEQPPKIYIRSAYFKIDRRKQRRKSIKSAFEMVRRSKTLISKSNLITSENLSRFHSVCHKLSLNFGFGSVANTEICQGLNHLYEHAFRIDKKIEIHSFVCTNV